MHSTSQLVTALNHLASLRINISDLLFFVLNCPPESYNITVLNAVEDLSFHFFPLLEMFGTHEGFADRTRQWALRCMAANLCDEIHQLTRKSTGWHGNAKCASIKTFESINAAALVTTAKQVSPLLWSLFGSLLSCGSKAAVEHDDVMDVDNGNNSIDFEDTSTLDQDSESDSELRLQELVSIIYQIHLCIPDN